MKQRLLLCCNMANPIVIDLTIDDSEEDSPSTIEEAPNACNQSDEEDLRTDDEEAPHSCKIKG